MRIRASAVAAVVAWAVLAAGCAAAPGGNSASGSLGVSRDDALLYVAEADLDQVLVVDARTSQVLSRVPVGRQPEKVLVGADDTVYVANRMGRSVSVLRRGDTAEATRLQVGVEPVGLAASADGRTLYVVNSTALTDASFGTVMAFDTASLTLRWEQPVGPEPRAIALLGDGRAAVTLYKGGDVVYLDARTGALVKAGTDLFDQLNRTALGHGSGLPTPRLDDGLRKPRGLEALAASPAGDRLYVAGLVSNLGTLRIPSTSSVGAGNDPGATTGGYGSGAGCGMGAVVAPVVMALDGQGHASVDDVLTCGSSATDRPATLIASAPSMMGPGTTLMQPRALATDATGSFLFVADFASNNVAVLATSSRVRVGPDLPAQGQALGAQVVPVGEGPSGIAVSHDGATAWVHTALDHSLTRLEARADGLVAAVATARLAEDVLPAAVVAGRKLFYSAVDPRMSSVGIACASCHLEGREDGHVWSFLDGPRQTPSLAGRMLGKTAPYHWSGEFPSLDGFMAQTIQARMGGTGATPEMEAQLLAFLDAQPVPDNPHRGVASAAAQRGAQVFARAGCDTCHGGEAFTLNNFADVGTFVRGGQVADEPQTLPHAGLNTPSLLGVARTAPYLHDGSAASLKARLLMGKQTDLHGSTSALTDGQVDDLVAYLETL